MFLLIGENLGGLIPCKAFVIVFQLFMSFSKEWSSW